MISILQPEFLSNVLGAQQSLWWLRAQITPQRVLQEQNSADAQIKSHVVHSLQQWMRDTGIEEGLEMELRLTGASSVLPEQAQQLPEGAGRMGDMSIVEEVGRG